MKYIINLGLSLLVLLLSACGLGSEDCRTSYDFQIPLELSTYDSIVQFGDTLHIRMLTDNIRLIDKIDDRLVTYPNFDPDIFVILINLDELPFQDEMINTEIIVSEDNPYNLLTHSRGFTSLGFDYIRADEFESEINLSFVMNLMPGTYGLYFRSLLEFYSDSIEFKNRCGNGNIRASLLLPEEKYINSDMLSENNLLIDDEYFQGKASEKTVTSSYYFRVVE